MPVQGIGGLFFRAKDPDSLNAWYRDHLDVGAGCTTDGAGEKSDWHWMTAGGPVVFAPFKADTDYFAADKAFMINLRVTDIDTMLETLREAGVEVTVDPEWDHPDTGRFARIHDPEGNAIELWQPPTP